MKAAVIGCVRFSRTILSQLLELDGIDIAGVVTKESSSFNADFQSLEPLARDRRIPCLAVEGNDQAAIAGWVRDIAPDVAFCVGWSYLLGPEILAIPGHGVIGYHPALLPRNRGRHPIVWALVLGLAETGSTFFVMDEGADSGAIVSQRRVTISDDDDAASLYGKLEAAAGEQLIDVAEGLNRGTLEPVPQDPAKASYWRKRGEKDGQIDWRMSAAGIRNLVRGLAHPYVGAHCVCRGRAYKVWKVAVAAAPRADVEPGRVLAVGADGVTVKCNDGAVTLVEHEIADSPFVGECL